MSFQFSFMVSEESDLAAANVSLFRHSPVFQMLCKRVAVMDYTFAFGCLKEMMRVAVYSIGMTQTSKLSTLQLYGFCSVSTFIWASFPVVITLGGGSESAWLQVALMSLSYSAFFWVWLRRTDGCFATRKAVKIAVKEIAAHKGLLLIQRVSLPAYLLAAAYTDPAVSAVLMETWILWYMISEFRSSGIAAADRARMLALLVLGLLGVAGVVYAQYGTVSLTSGWVAAAIVLACSFLQGANLKSSLDHGESVAAKLCSKNAVGGSALSVGLCSLVIGFVALAVHVWLAARGATVWLPTARQMAWSFPMWTLIAPYAFIALRNLNYHRATEQIGINLAYHFSAPLSLLGLWAVGARIYHPWVMAAGTLLIVTSAFIAGLRK